MYENFYHLRAKPFRLSPDPSFFFASRGHKRALAYLRYGLSQSEGFVVITGAPGTGKTTLAQILLQEMDQSDVVVAHLTTTQLEADEMLRMVLASFGLRYEGQNKASLLKTLEAFFMARSREHKRVLLVVDEAQNLPARSLEELRMLSNLQVGDKALLQTFLLGQVQFRQMLDHPDLEQLRQRVIANYHLSALGEDECQDYIERRLSHVGWDNDPHFTADAFSRIYEYTEGVPRRINMLCDRVMLFSSLEEKHEINTALLNDVTDELQSEISGKPIPRPVNVNELPDNVNEKLLDSSTESTMASVDEPQTPAFSSLPIETPAPNAASVEVEDSPAIAAQLNDGHLPDNGGLGRVMPDDGWMQHAVQAQPDDVDVQDGDNSEPAEMERFRVIAGGKEEKERALGAATARPANQPSSEVKAPIPDAPGDSQEIVLRKILRLVLAFHRSPRSFPGLDDPTQPLPYGITAIMELAIADDHVLTGLRQIAVMGISPSMLRAAVRFFVRRVLFLPGGDDFRVLGLTPGANLADVEEHYGLLMKLLRQDNKSNDESGTLRVGEAYERLCRSELAAQADDSTSEFADSDTFAEVDEELDLDLSPNSSLGGNAGLRHAPSEIDNIVTGENRAAPTVRNIMLVIGAAVIVFILYLTQIKTTGEPAPEMVADLPNKATVTELVAPVKKPFPAIKESMESIKADTTVAAQKGKSPLAGVMVNKDASLASREDQNNKAKEKSRQAALKLEEAAKKKAAAETKAKEEAEAALKVAAEAKLKLEASIRAAAKKQAAVEAKAVAEAKVKSEAKARAAEKAAADTKARKIAAAKATREKAAVQAKLDAEARAKVEAQVAAQAAAEREAAALKEIPQKVASGIIATTTLDDMLAVFSSAFQSADLKKLLSLHSPVVRTDKHIDLAGVRSDYQALFDNSNERSLKFENIAWERKPSYARGNGQYRITVKGEGKKTDYIETGDITLQVENRSGKLEIIRYYSSNPQIITQAKVAPVVAETPAIIVSKNPFSRIPVKQLDALLEKLVSSYTAGDINAFMALFAKDAQTNERASIKDIRKDYAELFDSTLLRSIAFEQLAWRLDGQAARAEGAYSVDVQRKGKNKPDHYQGQVWIQVERRNGAARITHFAFAEKGLN